ncbi:MAG: DUF2513 domain-containing protein [Cyanobacteria bacterium P01_F01_bin.86]
MKRDFNLIREMLIKVEEAEPGEAISVRSFRDNYSEKERSKISEHALLIEAEYVEGFCTKGMSSLTGISMPQNFQIHRLTWKGHEFIQDIRDDRDWKKVESFFTTHGLQITTTTISKVARELLLQGVIAAFQGGRT